MKSHLNKGMPGTELPKFCKGICWFCQNHCNTGGYTHEACIIDYFSKSKQPHVIKA
ncbi:MAG: hypothetical protein KGI19_06155 [Thaumarchaeota archaeon]|nr:hypothetical protein [Nitrososphaerota archaeon]